MVIYLWWMVKKHCLYEDFSTPRPLLTQLSGTGDPGQGDHSEIRTHDLLIESRMLWPRGYVPSHALTTGLCPFINQVSKFKNFLGKKHRKPPSARQLPPISLRASRSAPDPSSDFNKLIGRLMQRYQCWSLCWSNVFAILEVTCFFPWKTLFVWLMKLKVCVTTTGLTMIRTNDILLLQLLNIFFKYSVKNSDISHYARMLTYIISVIIAHGN